MKKRLYKLLTISSAVAASAGAVGFVVSCGSKSKDKVYTSSDLVQTGKNIDQWKTDFPEYASKIQNGKIVDNAFIEEDFSTKKAKDGSNFYLPSGIDEVGEAAFRRAKFPDGFKLPSTLKVIGKYAFQATSLPDKFVIPKTISTIATKAFADLTLPKRFIFDRYSNPDLIISDAAFVGTSFAVESGHASAEVSLKTYLSIKSAGGLKGDEDIASKDYTIPQDWSFPLSLDTISSGMFTKTVFPEDWKLPSSIKKIEMGAFVEATLPRGFSLGQNVVTVGMSAFFMAKVRSSFSVENFGSDRSYSFNDLAFAGIEFDLNTNPKVNAYTYDILKKCGAEKWYLPKKEYFTRFADTADGLKDNPTDTTYPDNLTPKQGELSANMKHIDTIHDLIAKNNGIIPDFAYANVDFKQNNQETTAVLNELQSVGTSIKGIGNRAFYGAKFPSDLILPNTITKIDASAFQDTEIGGALTIPSSVTEMGEAAFTGMKITGLTTFNAQVTTLPESTFEDVDLSHGFDWGSSKITKIGDKAFAATGIDWDDAQQGTLPTTFQLPITVTSLGSGALSAKFTHKLSIDRKISFASGVFKSAEFKGANARLDLSNSTIDNLGNEFAEYSKFLGGATLELPTGLKVVSISALQGATIPETFKLPATVETIKNSAFEDTQYDWKDTDVDELKINDWTKYAILRTVDNVNAGTTAHASTTAAKFDIGLNTLTNLTGIGEKAFAWNQTLKLGTFGEPEVDKTGKVISKGGVSVIYRPLGDGMSFNSDVANKLRTIGRGAFMNAELPSTFNLFQFTAAPEITSDSGLTLYPSAFFGAKIPSGFALPTGTATISPSLFENATFDGVLNMAGITQIGSKAFANVKVPFDFVGLDTVKTIGIQAFMNTILKSTFRIPNPQGGITIMDEAFVGARLEGHLSDELNWSALDKNSRPVGGATIVVPTTSAAAQPTPNPASPVDSLYN